MESKQNWLDNADPHAGFQLDLSCMLDGELDEARAGRVMLHIEGCGSCSDFLEDLRTQVRLHRDMTDPDRLFARVAMLTGTHLGEEAEAIDLIHKLATVFYQLGKSYVLSAIDPDFRTRVFEAAVSVNEIQSQGRGFVDGVLMKGTDHTGGVDWTHARHMLNGRLERIEDPLEKGRRLLEEAVAADPAHEEARLYLAFLHAHEGRYLRASEEYRQVFHTALCEENRGHAAMQLGRLHAGEEDFRKSLLYFRWITISGLDRRDSRFFGARFNLGKAYAMLGDRKRSLAAFRTLLDEHPDHAADVARLFAGAPKLRQVIEESSGFTEELVARCPELFSAPSAAGSAEGGESKEDF
jgi:tetratricopeptide (TPR) repeat protein